MQREPLREPGCLQAAVYRSAAFGDHTQTRSQRSVDVEQQLNSGAVEVADIDQIDHDRAATSDGPIKALPQLGQRVPNDVASHRDDQDSRDRVDVDFQLHPSSPNVPTTLAGPEYPRTARRNAPEP